MKASVLFKEYVWLVNTIRRAGRKYYEADLVWDKLRVGMPLRLEREPDNRYDPEAVQVIFHNDGEDFLLGYIPRCDNQCLAPFFNMGHDDLFDCRISRISPEKHPEEQIQLTVRIRRKEETDAEIENGHSFKK